MAVEFKNAPNSAAGLEELDAYFGSRSYVSGFAPSKADSSLYALLSNNIDASRNPNLARFANHIGSFSPNTRNGWTGVAVKVPEAAAASASNSAAPSQTLSTGDGQAEFEDEDVATYMRFLAANKDEWSDDDDAAPAPVKVEEKKEESKKKKKKSKKSNKGGKPKKEKYALVHVELMPDGSETDWVEVQKLVHKIQFPGVVKWGKGVEHDLAFGLMKLRISCQVVRGTPTEKITLDCEAIEMVSDVAIIGVEEI